jgi:ligand-binding sensor domain-containing protein
VAVALGNWQRVSEGGFVFRPLADYVVETAGGAVQLKSSTEPGEEGVAFFLTGAPPDQLVQFPAAEPAQLFAQYVTFYTQQDSFTAGEPYSATVNGHDGFAVDLLRTATDRRFAGRIVMVQPSATQLFVMVGVAPLARWESQVEREFAAMLASVSFFSPTAIAQTRNAPAPQAPISLTVIAPGHTTSAATSRSTPTPTRAATASVNWQSYTNANFANEVTASINTIWVATDGGVVAWNKSNNTPTKFTTLEGLAANRTTTVVNCPLRGFGVVFGSEAGLQIFDSQSDNWKLLNSGNSAMSFDDVSALHCDVRNRYLVVGYQQHGVDIFDAATGAWQYLGQNEGLQNNFVQAIGVVGDREELWVASGFGLSVVSKTGPPRFYDDSNSALETNQIRRIVTTANGVVWLGAQDALYRVDGDEWTVYDPRAVLASPFPKGLLNGLALAENGTLWIGSNQGEICHFDPVTVQCSEFFAKEPGMVAGELTSLAIGSNGAVYYTTAGDGFSMYDGAGWRVYRLRNEPLMDNQIHALAQDRTGAIWVASQTGLQQVDPQSGVAVRRFTQENSPFSNMARAVLHAGAAQGLWLGGLGASYFDGDKWSSYSVADGLAGTLVRAIASDSQGRTWFGTETGLSIWNGSIFFNLTRENGLPSDRIAALLANGDTMWIAADGGGLFRFEQNQLQLFTPENADLPSASIAVLASEPDGALLLGDAQGLARFAQGQATPIRELTGYAVTALATTAKGEIWVGARGDGLFYYNGSQWTEPPGSDQPPIGTISALLVADDGSVWIGTNTGGLIRYIKPE